MPLRLFIWLALALPLSAPALPWQAADDLAIALAGGGAALSGEDRPRLNPASGALYDGRRDVSVSTLGGPWAGRGTYTGAPVSEGRALAGGVGLPRLPVALAAWTQARFLRVQGGMGGRLLTREAWRVDSGATVAGRWRDRPGRGRRLAWGLSPKLVSLRLAAADEPLNGADASRPHLVRAHDGRLDLDAGILGGWAFRWRFALVGRDLFSRGAPWPAGGGSVDAGPRLTGALAWQGPRLALAMDLDLLPVHRGLGGRERRLALGLRLPAGEALELRAGLAPDLLGRAPLRLGTGLALRRGGLGLALSGQKEGPGRALAVLGLAWAF